MMNRTTMIKYKNHPVINLAQVFSICMVENRLYFHYSPKPGDSFKWDLIDEDESDILPMLKQQRF